MIKADISRENEKQAVLAEGAVPELANDVAVLLNSIYTQFLNMDAGTAEMFRVIVQGMVRDSSGACWKPMDGMTGIIFPKSKP